MNSRYILLSLAGLAIFGLVVLIWSADEWSAENSKMEAQKILDFRKSDPSCIKLRSLYLQYYDNKYTTFKNNDWYREIYTKFTEKCVDKTQLDNIEMVEICSDAHFTSCEISKLENPQLYENFDFKTAINNIKLKDGSESE